MAVTPPDIGGASLVFVGSFNPAILHPAWFAREGLLTDTEAERVEQKAAAHDAAFAVTPDVTVFETDWFILQATSDRLLLGATERRTESFLPLRDLAIGVLTILRHTPVEQMGMNHTRHMGLGEGRWEAFSDRIAPPSSWEGLLTTEPELGSLRVRMPRATYDAPGFIAVTIEPSLRIADGVFVSVNDHSELPTTPAGGAVAAVEVLRDYWEASYEEATELFRRIKQRA